MKLNSYLKDKLPQLLIYLSMYILLLLLFLAFKIQSSIICAVSIIILFYGIVLFLIDYFHKKKFYDELLFNLERIDQKYLVLETITPPNFYEGNILYQSIYGINKSMIEKIKNYEYSINDFKDYIEMWIHEVKLPLASATLMCHNHKNEIDKKLIEQMSRIDNYLEQVLYYVRSENAEKDYLIVENKLDKIISNVALKNKDDLLENNIDFIVENVDYSILTDSKWLEFIINQIVSNSIKYIAGRSSYIKISGDKIADKVLVTILDNGVGISASDLPKVFDKSFTGTNGRKVSKSTGMGLYIVKNLCNKLGHKIDIMSKENEYTKVILTFNKNNYFDVIK